MSRSLYEYREPLIEDVRSPRWPNFSQAIISIHKDALGVGIEVWTVGFYSNGVLLPALESMVRTVAALNLSCLVGDLICCAVSGSNQHTLPELLSDLFLKCMTYKLGVFIKSTWNLWTSVRILTTQAVVFNWSSLFWSQAKTHAYVLILALYIYIYIWSMVCVDIHS